MMNLITETGDPIFPTPEEFLREVAAEQARLGLDDAAMSIEMGLAEGAVASWKRSGAKIPGPGFRFNALRALQSNGS